MCLSDVFILIESIWLLTSLCYSYSAHLHIVGPINDFLYLLEMCVQVLIIFPKTFVLERFQGWVNTQQHSID